MERKPTYHKFQEATYVLPNDSPEHIRLETQAFHLSKMMHDNVLHAPVGPSPERVLDVGCGTGIVTDLMAKAFPDSDCIGLDLSIVPNVRSHLPNVHFFQGDIVSQTPTEWLPNDQNTARLSRDNEYFDHIYSRLLILGMKNWPDYIKTTFSLLKPGGWAEVHELSWLHWYDSDGKDRSESWSWLRTVNQSLTRKGMDTYCGNKAERWMHEAGFVDVQVAKYIYPMCGTSESTREMRNFGKFNSENLPIMFHHAIPRALSVGPDDEESKRLVEEMKECLRGGQGLWKYFYVTIGRKPRNLHSEKL